MKIETGDHSKIKKKTLGFVRNQESKSKTLGRRELKINKVDTAHQNLFDMGIKTMEKCDEKVGAELCQAKHRLS